MPLIFSQSAVFTADVDYELPAGMDLSLYRDMTLIVNLTNAGSQAANHLDVYLQHRWQDGAWIDRIHSIQFDGAQSATRDQRTVQSDVLLASGEQGALGALAEASQRNGPMPPIYYADGLNPGGQAGNKKPAANCRVHCDVTDGGTPDPSFTADIYLYASGIYPIAN